MRWYAVPRYAASAPPSDTRPFQQRPADVVDEAGEQVAEFERLCDAERAVRLHNEALEAERGRAAA